MDDIDRELSERYGYNRRHYQSDQRITIPVALLEEAMGASMPGGDAHSLLGRALECGPRTTTGEVLGTATLELQADPSKLYAKLDEAKAKVAAHVKALQEMLDSLNPGTAEDPVVVHSEGQTREVPQAPGEAMVDTFKRAFPETKAKRPLEVSLDLGWLEDALTKQRALTDRLVDLAQQQLDILKPAHEDNPLILAFEQQRTIRRIVREEFAEAVSKLGAEMLGLAKDEPDDHPAGSGPYGF